jgi:hypothetical protein
MPGREMAIPSKYASLVVSGKLAAHGYLTPSIPLPSREWGSY